MAFTAALFLLPSHPISRAFASKIALHRRDYIIDFVFTHLGICTPTKGAIHYAVGTVEFTAHFIVDSGECRVSDHISAKRGTGLNTGSVKMIAQTISIPARLA
jgi:hypothetical protein